MSIPSVFDFRGGEFAPGLVVLVTPDGSVGQVADDLAFPNGMAISPDGTTLIVAESYANRLTAYDIGSDGGLGNRRVWADTPGDHPDGICMDAEGAVWYADVGNQHCVRVCEGGEVLATVDLDRGAFACTLSRGENPRLFVVGQTWGGPGTTPPSGRVVAFPAPAPGAGRP
jgi:sugar lactone lactonase YvrE